MIYPPDSMALPLSITFGDWLRESDHHAAHHLNLLQQTDAALAVSHNGSPAERRKLANKLEHWRRQHSNECGGVFQPQDDALLDGLGLAANELLGRATRSPRRTRHAIGDPALDTGTLTEATNALDHLPTEKLARQATDLTWQHHERRMLLYAPLYVSSECINHCTYCGFRYPADIQRRHLDVEQVLGQARILQKARFQHLLVVGGDFPSRTTTDYYDTLIRALVAEGITPAVEIAAQTTLEYEQLVDAGICGVTLYQETYNLARYAEYHIRGPKSSFHWRLEGHDRAAEAGVKRLGLGALLGLSDPREELLALMRHVSYLESRFPECVKAISLPRIHEGPDGFVVPFAISDEDLLRFYCTLRIAFPRAELVLSTRESASLRDRLAKICITQMSAGSSTTPGGYEEESSADADHAGEQFSISDERSPEEIAAWLVGEKFQVAWNV